MNNEIKALMATKGEYKTVKAAVDSLKKMGMTNVMVRYVLDRGYGQALSQLCYIGTFDKNCKEGDCDNCPYNDGRFAGNGNLPCGQQNCWIYFENLQQ